MIFQWIPHLQHSSKKATPSSKVYPLPCFFADDAVWTPPLKHTRESQWWTHDIADKVSHVAVSKGNQVRWQPCILLECEAHTPVQEDRIAGALLALRRTWQRRMPCTSCWWAAAKFPALEGAGLPASQTFSAPFFGKKELLPWNCHFIKQRCRSASLARFNSADQNQGKAVSPQHAAIWPRFPLGSRNKGPRGQRSISKWEKGLEEVLTGLLSPKK